MTSKADTTTWPTSDDEDGDEAALLDTAQFTSSGPPPISRPSRWARWLKELEDRARDPDEEEDQATLGPFERPDQAYSVASRISRGKFPGADPAGKFDATARTLKKVDENGEAVLDEDGEPVKHTVVWVCVNPEYLADPDSFPHNGDSSSG